MLYAGAIAAREFAQRAHLVDNVIDDFVAAGIHPAAPEALQVAIARVGADADAALGGESHCQVHEIGVAGMEPGGDIGGTDEFQKMAVIGIGKAPLTETFSHIAIDIDDRDRHTVPLRKFPLQAVGQPFLSMLTHGLPIG